MTPTAALALCRFAGDASALLLWGACATLVWLVPHGLAAAVTDRLRPWIEGAVAAAADVTLAVLPTETASSRPAAERAKAVPDAVQRSSAGRRRASRAGARGWNP